ncbi:hypothetical protein LMH87_003441 [Akanthomyces muscarius]|uniref:Major facilitator superfamily (MFS) profile domain-containing protein n=1 Tax=Akanthomyces muscarius TaxID=2231603 RepID=A0A9W8Q1S9_AKAMU|nr:hypothetical protein LMH87_003441 [Akanthomyces muscarius]KAJ4144560.1 hypothetical protein LMH87_003441 [Akanthomyces muscarius]
MDDDTQSQRPPFYYRALAEVGLVTLYNSSRDIKLLCLQRFVRLFAYGVTTLILVAFLQELGHSRTRVGLFMTLTLVGDVVISFFLTLFADKLGRKAILSLGALLMAGSGAVFALFSNYWVLLLAAVLGVISPAGNEIGPFRAVEESIVAHLTAKEHRAEIYAWYTLFAPAGSAFGMMASGWAIEAARSQLHWSLLSAYRGAFVAYAIFGLFKFLLTVMLSRKVELEPTPIAPADTVDERAPLLDDGAAAESPAKKSRLASLLPHISPESKKITAILCVLFAIDSLGSGLASLSWVTFYFRSQFGIEEGRLGSLFFTTSIISAITVLVASSIAKRLGNVKTMVFTHLPSAVFLALIPIPSDPKFAIMFLVLRASLQSMDSAPRTAFMATILQPGERTSVMGAVNVVKTTAQSMGPLITGVLASHKFFWLTFVIAGSLKGTYDLLLLAVFRNYGRHRTG